MHCKDCKFWNRKTWECSEILSDKWRNKNESDHISLTIHADDDSGLYYDFAVGPDFGCIKFKEK